jgi:hypothetical protein
MSQFEAASNATYVANMLFIGALLASIVSGFAVAWVASKDDDDAEPAPVPQKTRLRMIPE